MNSVRPSIEQDGDTYPLKDLQDHQDGASTSRSRQKVAEHHVIGGIPSNWDVATTPSQRTNTNFEDNKVDTLYDEPSQQLTQDDQCNSKKSEWDTDSEEEESYNSKIKDVEKEISDKLVSGTEKMPVDFERGSLDSKGNHEGNSKRSQLDSDTEIEDKYKDTIDEREEDISDKHISGTEKIPMDYNRGSFGEYTPELPPAVKLNETYYKNPPSPMSDNTNKFVSFHPSNRVSPIDGTSKSMPKTNIGSMSKEELQRKKNIVIGADENTDGAGCCGWLLYFFSILLIVVTLPFSLIFCIKVVQEYERAVIFRLGRLPSGGAKGPGIFFIIPCIESYTKIDLRTVSFDVPPQEVLTKDSVTVSVDAVVYYRVSNPTISVANVENAHHSTRLLAQTTLRNILGTKNMSEILSDRESISQGMQSTLDEATDNWGIKVERVEIKDVRLPVQLQRAMAAEAEAAREARAKVIAAEGEQKASRALKEAADVMAKSSAALQLRYLQTLSSISAEKNSTIIFPLPVDLLNAFIDKKS